MIAETLFWLLAALVLYVYLGYPLLLLILSKIRPTPPIQKADITPTVSLLIPAYNEKKVIAQKIENSLALDYPRDKLEIIVASDGSTDDTNEIVKTFAKRGVKLVVLSDKQGKSSAQNRAVAEARGDILLFTDSDVMLQPVALRQVIRNFADDQVGCVIGKITYINEGD